ncbi:MAG: phosphate regulon sensor histidine kinase PhoR [Gammaproteobacteria bacterium]|nr:phosphate regulon sensor histidine kinase PhoR [Gammaproteobacteria bacterium]
MKRLLENQILHILPFLLGGWLSGSFFELLSLGLLLSLLWYHYQSRRLQRWCQEGFPPEHQELAGCLGEIQNTLQLQHQRQLRNKRKLIKQISRYRNIFNVIPGAFIILERDNHSIAWFNLNAKKLLGLQKSDMGHPLTQFVRNPALVEYLDKPKIEGALQIKSPLNSDFVLNIECFKLSRKQRALFARDISHSQRLEQMQREFISNVSHELRTPLTVLCGFVETMNDALTDGGKLSEWEEALDLMEQQSHRMNQIIDDLLLLSQLENHQLADAKHHPIDIKEMVGHLTRALLPLAQMKSIILTIHDLSDCGVHLLGNEREIYSAFYNLITNAIRYTQDGGEICISCTIDPSEFCFIVNDNGIGISEEDIPRITERFFRADVSRSRENGGTGLGLAIVKQVLLRHNAYLTIDSIPDVGSSFSCHFPSRQFELF